MYGVFFKNGLLGFVSNSPKFITEDKELAKQKAKFYRALLTSDERSSYKMSYVVRPYNDFVRV